MMFLFAIDGYLIELQPGTGPWSRPSCANAKRTHAMRTRRTGFVKQLGHPA